jgi:hypothetical protein
MWSASGPGLFTSGEETSRVPLESGLGGPQSRTGFYEGEKNVIPTGNQSPAVQTVARRHTNCTIPGF